MSAYDLCHSGQGLKQWYTESLISSLLSFRNNSVLLGALFFLPFETIFVCAAKIDKVTGNTVYGMPNIITSNINFLLIELLCKRYHTWSSKVIYILYIYLSHGFISSSPDILISVKHIYWLWLWFCSRHKYAIEGKLKLISSCRPAFVYVCLDSLQPLIYPLQPLQSVTLSFDDSLQQGGLMPQGGTQPLIVFMRNTCGTEPEAALLRRPGPEKSLSCSSLLISHS